MTGSSCSSVAALFGYRVQMGSAECRTQYSELCSNQQPPFTLADQGSSSTSQYQATRPILGHCAFQARWLDKQQSYQLASVDAPLQPNSHWHGAVRVQGAIASALRGGSTTTYALPSCPQRDFLFDLLPLLWRQLPTSIEQSANQKRQRPNGPEV